MTFQDKITSFNKSILYASGRYDIIEYIKDINKLRTNLINLSFMEELLNYVTEYTCCIPGELLVKYGVLGNKNISADIKRMMNDYEFVENEDFSLLCNVAEQSENSRGIKYKNIYLLHPNTFKYCLMRSKNTRIYANYYILLEESIKYYHDYQTMYKEYIIAQKDDRIDCLTKKVDEQSVKIDEVLLKNDDMKRQNDEQSAEIKKLLGYAKYNEERVTNIEEELEDTNNGLYQTITELSVVQRKLGISVEDRAIKPSNETMINQLAIIRYKPGIEYKLLCGQEKYISNNTSGVYDYITIVDKVPNSIYLFQQIKTKLKTYAIVSRRSVILTNITHDEFIEKIMELFDERLEV